MTMRIPTASGSATPAQISMGTKVEEVAEASGKSVEAPKEDGFMPMTPQDYKSMDEANKVAQGVEGFDPEQIREMKSSTRAPDQPSYSPTFSNKRDISKTRWGNEYYNLGY